MASTYVTSNHPQGSITRVAAIYDIHGNFPALEAVLRDIEKVNPDAILVGGDLASGPLPRETLERLMTLGAHVHVIRGNADRELVDCFDRSSDAAAEGVEDDIWILRDKWAARQITREQRDFLASLPEAKVFDIQGVGPVLFCHGSPRNDEEIITARTPDTRLRLILAGVEESLVVCGHTHMQFDRILDRMRVVNAGSVGMPYEPEPGAYWALLGPDVTLRRTVYDFNEAAEQIRRTRFPGADDHVAHLFSELPSREEVIRFFEKLAKEREEGG